MKRVHYQLVLPVFLLVCSFRVLSQTYIDTSFVLNTAQSGTKEYIAREKITLQPGFSYTPSSGSTFTARIDQTLVFPPTGNTYAMPNGTITNNPEQGAVVGNLSGALDVSPTGAATYSVPIACPPGIQGMQPAIALVYNSQSGNGIAGMCWNISGLSMISRVSQNYYYDDERSGIIWDQTSPLALDGQRLIKIQEWGTDSIEYQTESGIDKIIGYNILFSGPLYFKIYTQSGNILEYGNPESPPSYYPIRSAPGTGIISASEFRHLGWALTRMIDANNNYIEFNYTSDIVGRLGSGYDHNSTRITSLIYGNNTTGNKEVIGKIQFFYTDKSSSFPQYIDGYCLYNNYIIDEIRVKSVGDQLIGTYQLTYDVKDQNDFLTEMKQINASGEYVHPLKFEWSERNYAISDTIKMTFSEHPSYVTYCKNQGYSIDRFEKLFGDINGDGLTDVIVKATYKKGNDEKHYWIAYVNNNVNSNLYQYVYEHEWDKDKEPIFLLVDRDHDGADELYIGKYSNETSNRYYFRIDCYKYKSATMNYSFDSSRSVSSSDYSNRKDSYIVPIDYLGNGDSYFLLFSKDNKLLDPLDFGSNSLSGNANSRVYFTDINGNGKSEIMYIVNNTTTFYEYNSSLNQFEIIDTESGFSYEDQIYTGDFNGDGNTDLLVQKKGTYENVIWISTGKSLYQTSLGDNIINSNNTISVYYGTNKVMIFRPTKQLLDLNQDGKTDVVSCDFPVGSSLSRLKIYISTGNGFEEKESSDLPFEALKSLRGIGRFGSIANKGVVTESWFNSPSFYYVTLCPNVQFNKITGVTDAFDTKVNISYQNINTPQKIKVKIDSNTDNESTCAISHSLPTELEVIKNVTTTNVNTNYTFNNPHIHWRGRGFLGFDSIRVQDNINFIVTITKSKLNSTFYFLYPYKSMLQTTGGTKINENISNYTITNEGSKKYFLRLDSQVSTDVLKGITNTTSYSNYDTERNPQTILTDLGNGITSTKTLTYIKKGSQFLNKISYHKVIQTTPNSSNYIREEYFFYDDKGNLSRQTKDSTDTNKVQIFYNNYDKYGNPQNITTKANDISRSQSFIYTPSGRFIYSKTDHFGNTTTYNWNESKGLLNSESNRLGTTSYNYDNWGRLTNTTYPDGLKSVATLQWAGNTAVKPINAKYYSYAETSGQSPVITWYDALGRELRTESYGLNKKKIWVDTEYNAKGQVYRVSEPYFETDTKTWATTYTYDTYGRVQTMVTPMGTTSYNYVGLKTTVTTPTDTKETTINSAGQVITEKTNGKEVTFTHYASGLVKTATPQGSPAISIKYDLQGNRTELSDPDAGTITSRYDGWGQLVREAQRVHLAGDSIVTTYNYHPSGLVNYQLRNGEYTRYRYDSSNRLGSISIAGKHAQGFTYDGYDRIIQVNDTVDGSKVFVRKTEYDVLGTIHKETYPGDYSVTNQYDRYGYLTGVTDRNGSNIWSALESNARGQLTRTQSGNKITDFGFDSKGFPVSIVTPGIASWSYVFNGKGNLVSRKDGITNYKDSLTYDSMNRLTAWNVYFNNSLQQNNSLAYHATTGNIQSKSDLGNYTMNYGANGKPHALTSITGVPGVLPTDSLVVTYTDFKKVKTLTEGIKNYTLSYGVDEQRIKSVYKVNNVIQKTRYYMGNYEEEISNGNTRKIHYLSGGNGLAAIYVQNNGNDTLYYVHTDYQGSLTAISLANDTVKERYAFDPWGNRRNPTNWTQSDTRTTFLFNRGYTLHEHLPEFKVINMNGRVYDPLTAMFFSPDPYLQAPGDWLNYNRYAYCLNNPFRYTDPSGDFFWLIPSIGYSRSGGWHFGLTVGVGIPGAFSANVSVGYSTGNGGDFTATAGASFGGFNAYGGYSTAAGGIAGAGFGFGGGSLGIFGISSSVLGAGINYSEAGGWSVNALGFQYGKGGLSSDPSIGVSATARWGIEYSVLESSESIGVVGKDQASITTDDQLNEFLDQRGVNYADYYASDVSIEKQIPNQLEGRYTDLYNRYRRNNGVISSLKNGQSVGGITVSLLNGFKRPYSLIYMSTHDTNRNLMISLNHEFIHSWQYAKFGYSDRKEWDKFAEASAYRYTKMYHLSVSVPTYLGPWFPFLYVWPKLPLIQ